MKRRLRKKLRRGEFRELAFAVQFLLVAGASETERDVFLDQWIDAVEARGLGFTGSGDQAWDGVIARLGRGSATEENRVYIEGWLREHPAVREYTAGPLSDAWYGEW